jgi:hypothetical protein
MARRIIAWIAAVGLAAPTLAQDGRPPRADQVPPTPAGEDRLSPSDRAMQPVGASSQAAPATADALTNSPISLSRVAAGIRHYPAQTVRSLLILADEPLVLRQLADNPDLMQNPDTITPPVSDAVKAAIRELSATPAIIAIAAAHPAEMKLLRQAYAEAPEGMEQRIGELRASYSTARAESAAGWQTLLEQDPQALAQYRKLLTQFTREQTQRYSDFPFVHVTAGEYYYAAVPNDAVMIYADEHRAELGDLWGVLTQWWSQHGPEAVDERALQRGHRPAEQQAANAIATLPAEKRTDMWKPTGGDVPASIGFVPVIMQPLADQPAEARYAFAIADQARLWTTPLSAEEENAFAEQEGAQENGAEYAQEPAREQDRQPAVASQPGYAAEPPPERAYIIENPIVEEPVIVERPYVVERRIVEEVPVYYPDFRYYDPYDYYGATISYRHYYADVFPYFYGFPAYSPVYAGCFPYEYGYYHRHHRGFHGSLRLGGDFHPGINIQGRDHHDRFDRHGVGRFLPGLLGERDRTSRVVGRDSDRDVVARSYRVDSRGVVPRTSAGRNAIPTRISRSAVDGGRRATSDGVAVNRREAGGTAINRDGAGSTTRRESGGSVIRRDATGALQRQSAGAAVTRSASGTTQRSEAERRSSDATRGSRTIGRLPASSSGSRGVIRPGSSATPQRSSSATPQRNSTAPQRGNSATPQRSGISRPSSGSALRSIRPAQSGSSSTSRSATVPRSSGASRSVTVPRSSGASRSVGSSRSAGASRSVGTPRSSGSSSRTIHRSTPRSSSPRSASSLRSGSSARAGSSSRSGASLGRSSSPARSSRSISRSPSRSSSSRSIGRSSSSRSSSRSTGRTSRGSSRRP